MTKLTCETVVMAAMAAADGSAPELTAEQIDAHLAGCSDCSTEVEQMRVLTNLLDAQKRRQRTENVWTLIEGRLPAQPATTETWIPFMVLGVVLLGYRLLELVPDRDFGFVFKVVPILFVIALFSYLKENPFKVCSEIGI